MIGSQNQIEFQKRVNSTQPKFISSNEVLTKVQLPSIKQGHVMKNQLEMSYTLKDNRSFFNPYSVNFSIPRLEKVQNKMKDNTQINQKDEKTQLLGSKKQQNQNSYPKLSKYAVQGGLTNAQQKALKEIVQNKPVLAASLDLYVGSSLAANQSSKQSQPNYYYQYIGQGNFNQSPYAVNQKLQQDMDFSLNINSSNKVFPQAYIKQRYKEQVLDNVENIRSIQQKLQKSKKESQNLVKTYYSQSEQKQYYYFLGKGNNHMLVKRVLDTRDYFKEVQNSYNLIHFKWCQLSKHINFLHVNSSNAIKRVVNHFEFHHEITTKSGMLNNLQEYLQNNSEKHGNLTAFDITPITFHVNFGDKKWEQDLQQFLIFYLENQPQNLKSGKNHIEIKKKLKKIYGTQQQGQKDLKKQYEIDEIFMKNKENYIWLLKPINLNRGRGIEVFKDLNQLENLFNDYLEGIQDKNFFELSKERQNQQVQKSPLYKSFDGLSQFEVVQEEEQNMNLKKNEQVNNQQINQNPLDNEISKQNNLKEQKNSQIDNQLEQDFDQNQKNKNINEQDIQQNEIIQKESPNKMGITQNKSDQNKNIESSKPNNNIKLPSLKQTLQNEQIQEQQNYNQSQKDSKTKKNKKKMQSSISYPMNSKYLLRESSFVIQKYVERPLLLNNRKFDIRVWALLTNDMNVYIFKEGYLRTSSEEYNLNDIENPFIHLTNNAVQKYSKNYGNIEDGNQLSYKQFQDYLDKIHTESQEPDKKHGKVSEMIKLIHQYIEITFLSVSQKINSNNRKLCFEIFGFDFIVDENFKVWLIEVNTNPCIEESSPMLKQYLSRMLNDAFKLTIDKIFLTPVKKCDTTEQKSADQEDSNSKSKKVLQQIYCNNPMNLNFPSMNQQQNLNKNIQQSQQNSTNNNDDNNIKQQQQAYIQNQENLQNCDQNQLPRQATKHQNTIQDDPIQHTHSENQQLQIDLESSKENKKLREEDEKQTKQEQEQKQIQHFPVEGYDDQINMWEFRLNIQHVK